MRTIIIKPVHFIVHKGSYRNLKEPVHSPNGSEFDGKYGFIKVGISSLLEFVSDPNFTLDFVCGSLNSIFFLVHVAELLLLMVHGAESFGE